MVCSIFVKQDYFRADGQIYAAPRSFGQTPLAVNTDEVSAEEVTSLSVLFDQDYEGLVGHRDDARLQFLYERAANGKTPLNPSSADQVDFADTRDNLERHVELAGDLVGVTGVALNSFFDQDRSPLSRSGTTSSTR